MADLVQEWIDRKNQRTARHREILAVLMRELVEQKRLADVPKLYIYGLCNLIIWESLMNANVRLGDWFWEALQYSAPARPRNMEYGTLLSLESPTHAELSVYLRNPRANLYQLESIYKQARAEHPMIVMGLRQMEALAAMPNAPSRITKSLSISQGAMATVLTIRALLNRVFRILAPRADLDDEYHYIMDETIALTRQCFSVRPFGSGILPELIKPVWAASHDGYRCDELEALLLEFANDFIDANYLEDARVMKARFEDLEAYQRSGRVGEGMSGCEMM
jgi:hypothetical protein